MRRKVSLLIKILQTTIRLPLISLWNLGKIQFEFPVAISGGSMIQAHGSGKILLGSRCEIERNTKIFAASGEIDIGNRVYINRNGIIVSHKTIKIGEGTTMGPNVVIYDHDHDFRDKKGFVSAPIIIGNNVWIGSNVIILKGVTIGDNSVIGAGCVITKDIPENVVVVNSTQHYIKEIKRG